MSEFGLVVLVLFKGFDFFTVKFLYFLAVELALVKLDANDV